MIQIKEFMAEKMESRKHISVSKKSKKLFLALFATLLIVAAIVGVVTGVNSRKNSGNNQLSAAAHAVLKSSCSSTLYPDLCYSAIANTPGASAKLASQKDVIEASLNLTTEAVEHNCFAVKKLIKTRKNLTKREKTALHDCLETIDKTLDELHEAVEDLHLYPNKKSLSLQNRIQRCIPTKSRQKTALQDPFLAQIMEIIICEQQVSH
jgi:pectinesterase